MIDWNRIAELQAEVGEDAIEEVVTLFIEEVGDAVAALAETDDPSALSETLHFLKGSAQNIGLEGLGAVCAREELALRDDQGHSVAIEEIAMALKNAATELDGLTA